FKRAFPRARVTALEPDPRLSEFLRRNVHGNGFTDVRLIQKAAWHEAARIPFFPDGADGGRAATPNPGHTGTGRPEGTDTVEVEAIDTAQLLREEAYDFVKMDIEGAERAVIPA